MCPVYGDMKLCHLPADDASQLCCPLARVASNTCKPVQLNMVISIIENERFGAQRVCVRLEHKHDYIDADKVLILRYHIQSGRLNSANNFANWHTK